MIIHLNGWPGVGKKTIGSVVAASLGARFIHNHLLHDVAIRCCGLGDPARWTLYDEVRRAAYDALAARPRTETFVMTNALCSGSARERAAWDHVVDLAARRQVPLLPVLLEAEVPEIERRLQNPDRVGRKMVDPRLLRSMIRADDLQKPNLPGLLVLDVTRLSPDAAAARIVLHASQRSAAWVP